MFSLIEKLILFLFNPDSILKDFLKVYNTKGKMQKVGTVEGETFQSKGVTYPVTGKMKVVAQICRINYVDFILYCLLYKFAFGLFNNSFLILGIAILVMNFIFTRCRIAYFNKVCQDTLSASK